MKRSEFLEIRTKARPVILEKVKAKLAIEVAEDVAAYLKGKGKITKVKPGVISVKGQTAKQQNKLTYDQDVANGKKKDLTK